MNTTQQTTLNGTPCIMLSAGGYEAYIAYEIGSNVIRLRDVKNNIDVFRYSPDNTAETLMQSAEVWGLPTLYLPNRFADGILKTLTVKSVTFNTIGDITAGLVTE